MLTPTPPVSDEDEAKPGWLLTFFRRVRQLMVDFAIIAFIAGLLAAIGPSLLKPSVVIDGITVPTSLEERGYSGDVVARRLRDELRQIIQVARPTILGSLNLTDVSVEQQLPDLEAPGGLNVRWLVTTIRGLFDLDDIHISGELTVDKKSVPATTRASKKTADDDETEPPPTYTLKLRSRNTGPFYQTREASEDLQSIFKAAAVSILETSNPALAGRHYEINRQLGDAERMARQLIVSKKPGEHAQGLILRGNVHLRRQNFDLALADFREALQAEPKNALAAVNIAWANMRANRHEESIAAADAAIAISPRAASAYAHKANSLRLLGRSREAIAVALAGVDLEPQNGQPLVALAAAYNSLRRWKEGLDTAQRAVDRDPNYGSAHLVMGFALQNLGRQEEALVAFRRGVDLDPTWSRGWLFLGQALKRAGQPKPALDALTEAVKLEPSTGEYHFERGLLQDALKMQDDAAASFQQAGERGYKVGDSSLYVARHHLRRSRTTDALAAFQQATSADAGQASVWTEWAQLLLKTRRHEDAVMVLTRAHDKWPKDATISKLRGDALVLRNEPSKALDAYDSAIENDPSLKAVLAPIRAKLLKSPALRSASNARP